MAQSRIFPFIAGLAGMIIGTAVAPLLAQSPPGSSRLQSAPVPALVKEVCASCHATAGVGGSPHPAAPPFRRLANDYDLDKLEEALEQGTILPTHPDMPLFKLDRKEARDVINYIRSIQE